MKDATSTVIEVGPVEGCPSTKPDLETLTLHYPKNDLTVLNFFQYAQATWKVTLRYILPSYVFVLISIGPCMAVLLPQLYFALIPYHINFTGSIDEMSPNDKWQYLGVSVLTGGILTCTSIIMLRNVLIWDQPVDDSAALNRYCWISTILSVVTTMGSVGMNVYRFHGVDLGLWQEIVASSCIFITFWCVHMATRHNEGSKPIHSVLAAIVVAVDLAYGILVSSTSAFYQSVYFTWTSPFIYSVTGIFSRKIAEVSTYPMITAARVCTISLGFNQIFVRGNHTVYLDDVAVMIGFEFFYSFVSILTKVSLYYRHALVHKLTAGECKLVVKTTERGHYISTDMNVVDSVFECGTFVICSCLRQVVSPVSWEVWVFLVIFCLVVQFWNNLLSLLVSGYIEGIQFDRIVLKQRFDWNTLKRDIYYYIVSLVATICFLLGMLMNMWNPNSRPVTL